MFSIGDRVAHPLHGAGTISDIEHKKIDGILKDYYVMIIPKGDMRVMIPVDACEAVGLRPILDSKSAELILERIRDIKIHEDPNWNKRYRDNMMKIRSGDLLEVASVIKSLVIRDAQKGLSTGERKMLHSAKQIILSELVLCFDCSYSDAEEKLAGAIN